MKSSVILLCVSALGLLAAACSVVAPAQFDPTRRYVLSAPAPSPEGADHASAGTLRLGLKNVTLPGYLKSRSMVVRSGTNELVLAEYAQWAEPLDAGISRILRSYLASAPSVSRVYGEPFPFDADRDYDIAVTINRCEGVTGAGDRATIRFEALIEITKPDGNGQVVVRRLFVAPEESWNGKDFGRLAGLLSRAVEALARSVVAALPPSS